MKSFVRTMMTGSVGTGIFALRASRGESVLFVVLCAHRSSVSFLVL